MQKIASILLVLNGIAFAGTGVYALAAPAEVAASVGLAVNGASGHNEFLATFGGMFLGYGLYLLAALRHAAWRPGALVSLGVLCAGLFGGRVFSTVVHGVPEVHQLVFGAWELATASLALTLSARGATPA